MSRITPNCANTRMNSFLSFLRRGNDKREAFIRIIRIFVSFVIQFFSSSFGCGCAALCASWLSYLLLFVVFVYIRVIRVP